MGLQEGNDLGHAFTALEICKDEGPRCPRLPGILPHPFKVDPDMRGKIGLVDQQQIGAGDRRPALAGNVLALADRNDIDRQVGKIGLYPCLAASCCTVLPIILSGLPA